MAFFKLRSSARDGGGENRRNAAGSAESVEAMRRRARHRLIGATVLVAAGVLGFPLLFDTQPRPVAVNDIPIEIPDKQRAQPLELPTRSAQGLPTTPAAPTASAALPATVPPPTKAAAAPERPGETTAKVESRPEPPGAGESDKKPVERTPDKLAVDKKDSKSRDSAGKAVADAATAKPDGRPTPPAGPSRDELRIAKAEEAARARALLQGKSEKEAAAAAASAGRRFIVQIGAFSEPDRAQAARQKVERAGLKTFTQETKTGAQTWTRVRVGPFATRAEADEAAARIKGSGLPASILTL